MSKTPEGWEPPKLQRAADGRLAYSVRDGSVLRDFVTDRSPVAVIRGPIGSGKSVGCMMRVWFTATEQRPSPQDKIKRSRWGVVRNTYPDLKNTTIKTWLNLFPENVYGKFKWSMPFSHTIRVYDIELEMIFLALDNPEDVSKLRSLELTGVYFNELQYIHKELFDEAQSRVGRYPALKDGGAVWSGVIADMNEPEEDHFIPLMTGEVPFPDGMSVEDQQRLTWPSHWFYRQQPAALIEVFGPDGKAVVGYKPNPLAENTEWLKPGYYTDMLPGKAKAWIDSRLMNRVNVYAEGDPVHMAFRSETHVARTELKPVPGHPLLIGLDFGRSPAALIGQFINNRWLILDEMIGHNEGAMIFAPRLKQRLEMRYPGFSYQAFGDPKGQDKGQADERTAYDIFRAHGITVRPAPVKQNAIQTRLDAVDRVLTTMWDGQPRLLISPSVRTYRAALAGKYCWKKGDDGKKEPDKNRFSHVADAGQYLFVGGGEAREMIGLTRHVAGPGAEAPMRLVKRRGAQRRV